MKTSDEMVSSLLKRRDEYVARQKQKRQTVMKITSVTCAFALVALVGLGVGQSGWLESPAPTADTPVTEPTQPTEPSGYGIGGDENMCKEHNMMYHAIPTDLRGCADYIESKGGDLTEEDTIITFVQWAEISKEEFIESMHWEDKLDEIALSHGNGCPYTYGQYLDAIYGDNPDLTAWVFNTPETEWPYYEGEWWNLEEDNVNWPPEGYGFGETPNEEVAPIEPAE